jgi:hypothetical protein
MAVSDWVSERIMHNGRLDAKVAYATYLAFLGWTALRMWNRNCVVQVSLCVR